MKALLAQLRARPHLMLSVSAGATAALSLVTQPWVTRLLVGWNVFTWSYLVQAAWVMSRQDHHHLRRTAIAQSAGAGAVLTTIIAAVIASVTAIALELARVKGAPPGEAWPHIAFALTTVAGSWLLLPTLFALTYASLFHRHAGGHGLLFPGGPDTEPPDYWDFLYFSFTIAVASQTADVSIVSTAMRRLVLLQAVLSFAFNTAILALMVNIAAGLI
ncbi:DUF1345 domain-containing protein [Piscinibacter gummiphilus]|uniref:DUF1345 domain-containing protein n=1 Tax=Piscinibacter gummiphilus TaxID=946333 RepID=A0ABZ0CXD0_9BURK|nr:DUF1345 domain-containing protein [Piscinibacter gummiphilus]WOB09625.1 DUF1345 domain-containing protein [Piscinibacter gummiphilus]